MSTSQFEVWVKPWIKVRGHEEEPDGFSLHHSREHVDYFAKRHRDSLPCYQPTEYSSPKGETYTARVDQTIFEQIPKKEFGARFDRLSKNGNPTWVIRSKKD
jgi:hypothetical protein